MTRKNPIKTVKTKKNGGIKVTDSLNRKKAYQIQKDQCKCLLCIRDRRLAALTQKKQQYTDDEKNKVTVLKQLNKGKAFQIWKDHCECLLCVSDRRQEALIRKKQQHTEDGGNKAAVLKQKDFKDVSLQVCTSFLSPAGDKLRKTDYPHLTSYSLDQNPYYVRVNEIPINYYKFEETVSEDTDNSSRNENVSDYNVRKRKSSEVLVKDNALKSIKIDLEYPEGCVRHSASFFKSLGFKYEINKRQKENCRTARVDTKVKDVYTKTIYTSPLMHNIYESPSAECSMDWEPDSNSTVNKVDTNPAEDVGAKMINYPAVSNAESHVVLANETVLHTEDVKQMQNSSALTHGNESENIKMDDFPLAQIKLDRATDSLYLSNKLEDLEQSESATNFNTVGSKVTEIRVTSSNEPLIKQTNYTSNSNDGRPPYCQNEIIISESSRSNYPPMSHSESHETVGKEIVLDVKDKIQLQNSSVVIHENESEYVSKIDSSSLPQVKINSNITSDANCNTVHTDNKLACIRSPNISISRSSSKESNYIENSNTSRNKVPIPNILRVQYTVFKALSRVIGCNTSNKKLKIPENLLHSAATTTNENQVDNGSNFYEKPSSECSMNWKSDANSNINKVDENNKKQWISRERSDTIVHCSTGDSKLVLTSKEGDNKLPVTSSEEQIINKSNFNSDLSDGQPMYFQTEIIDSESNRLNYPTMSHDEIYAMFGNENILHAKDNKQVRKSSAFTCGSELEDVRKIECPLRYNVYESPSNECSVDLESDSNSAASEVDTKPTQDEASKSIEKKEIILHTKEEKQMHTASALAIGNGSENVSNIGDYSLSYWKMDRDIDFMSLSNKVESCEQSELASNHNTNDSKITEMTFIPNKEPVIKHSNYTSNLTGGQLSNSQNEIISSRSDCSNYPAMSHAENKATVRKEPILSSQDNKKMQNPSVPTCGNELKYVKRICDSSLPHIKTESGHPSLTHIKMKSDDLLLPQNKMEKGIDSTYLSNNLVSHELSEAGVNCNTANGKVAGMTFISKKDPMIKQSNYTLSISDGLPPYSQNKNISARSNRSNDAENILKILKYAEKDSITDREITDIQSKIFNEMKKMDTTREQDKCSQLLSERYSRIPLTESQESAMHLEDFLHTSYKNRRQIVRRNDAENFGSREVYTCKHCN